MMKVQILGHSAVGEEVKSYLKEAGVVEITDVSIEEETPPAEKEDLRDIESRLEQAESAIEFFGGYIEQPSFFQKISKGPLYVSGEELERLSREISIEEVYNDCCRLQGTIRSMRDLLADSDELVSSLTPWKDLDVPLQDLATDGYNVQFWTVQDKIADRNIGKFREDFELCDCSEFHRENGKSYIVVIAASELYSELIEAMKELGAHHHSFGHLEGTPAEIIGMQGKLCEGYRKNIAEAEDEARRLASKRDELCLLADHYRERIGLLSAEDRFYYTDSTFILEGWVRALDRPGLENGLSETFDEIETSFRDPSDGENPPISLENGPAAKPYEFVTSLYGRPVYREVDPTPLLAPFFILFFAMCLTDAGYGLSLAALTSFIIIKFKPSGGAGLLMKVLFMGGLITSGVGIVAGGIFGINAGAFPAWLQNFVFIDPLREPMKMLNISFLMGLVHMIFGMGVRLTADIRARLISDAIFDDLTWMLFLIVLAPLGYTGILNGTLPAGVMVVSKWGAVGLAAVIFLTGGRKQKSPVKKALSGLVKFYDVIGYFGDVLSYARLLALGLATSAIAIAVNDIAAMVKGMPFYTGYIAMVLILAGGHAFNLAVNTLGAFVHAGRLQYLEFFSKFFTGGGREFRPFKSERKFSVLKKN